MKSFCASDSRAHSALITLQALRSGAAPSKPSRAAAASTGSLVKRLEARESRALEKAQRIEHEIKRVKESHGVLSKHEAERRFLGGAQKQGNKPTAAGAPISITINNYEEPRGRKRERRDGLSKLAAAERRASAVLTSLRLKQNIKDDQSGWMMLKQENCSLAQQFDKNLTTLPLIESEEECALPNVWDADHEECVASPIGGAGAEPVNCMIKGPQSCICKNWAEAHMEKVDAYRKLLRDNFEFRYEAEFGKLKPDGDREYAYEGYQGSYRKGIFMGGRRHPLTKWGKPIPQRFPHKSGADLGDNWISGFSDRHPGGYEAYEEDLHHELEDHMVPGIFLFLIPAFVGGLCLGCHTRAVPTHD